MRSTFFAKLLLGVLPLIGVASGCTPYQGSATAYLTWHVVDAREPDPLTAPSLECALKNVQDVYKRQVLPESVEHSRQISAWWSMM